MVGYQAQIVPKHQVPELPDLVRLCLPGRLLQVELFDEVGMSEDVMTSTLAVQFESQPARQPDEVVESYVGDFTGLDTPKQAFGPHTGNRIVPAPSEIGSVRRERETWI